MRSLPIGLMVLGLVGIALVGITSPAFPANEVVIGVLDFEMIGPRFAASEKGRQGKRALMKELRRNTRVKLVDISESCSVSDLKKNAYEQAERYRNNYQLDMILHVQMSGAYAGDSRSYLTLMDVYTKKVREVSTKADISIEFVFRGICRKILVSQDLNRVLREKRKLLAKKEATVPKEDKKEIIGQERATKEIASPAAPVNKVVIGVLDFEMSGPTIRQPPEKKKALMRELRRNTRIKLVDIRESCSFSDLKRNGYEKAERYKDMYQLDMILHTHGIPAISTQTTRHAYFSLLDLYTKRVKEVSIETVGIPIEHGFRGISKKLLVSQDLNRVLREKKKVLAKKEATVPKEVKEIPKEEIKESPQEIEDPLIQNGPTLIAEGGYNRVLELIDDLPGRRRKNIQIQILECFANLKGWVWNRDESCKLNWSNLRQRLIISGDTEATPMLVIFLRDEDPWMRLYAAELLGHIGDERALKALRDVGTNDENHKVRRYAKKAYKQISGGEF